MLFAVSLPVILCIAISGVLIPTSSTEAAPTPSTTPAVVAKAPRLWASAAGQEDASCSRTEPCSLEKAIRVAIAGTSVHILQGAYEGGLHVLRPISLIGNGDVVIDGGHKQRCIWFDNVPAQVTGVTFQNGYGQQGGCVLVSMLHERHDEGNNFTRCTFVNCTGVMSSTVLPTAFPHSTAVGGGLAVIYHSSLGRAAQISNSAFSDNYARGKFGPTGGGMVVHNGAPHEVATSVCRSLLLSYSGTRSLGVASEILKYPVVLVDGVRVNGSPVWFSHELPKLPGAKALRFALAYCAETEQWTVAPVTRRLTEHDPCNYWLLSSQQKTSDPTRATKWTLKSSSVTKSNNFLLWKCQDILCPSLELSGAVPPQQHRNGVYHQMESDKQAYKKVESGSHTHLYIWYCPHSTEWIVTDDPPTAASEKENCSRGIASLPTLDDSFPLLARSGWRYWDTGAWKSSPGRGGILLTCTPRPQDTCQFLELVNNPYPELSSGVFVLQDFMWNGRPTYKHAASSDFIWYCGTFSEWVVTSVDPKTLDYKDEICSRPLSSQFTTVSHPTAIQSRWAYFVNGNWSLVPKSFYVRCMDDCPALNVDRLVAKKYTGTYEAVGVGERGTRIYQQQDGADVFLLLSEAVGGWVLTTNLEASQADPFDGVIAASFHNENSVLATSLWYRYRPESAGKWELLRRDPWFSCNSQRTCAVVNVTRLPRRYSQLEGLYARTHGMRGGKPLFQHTVQNAKDPNNPSFISYCAAHRRWIIGPKSTMQQCKGWVGSRNTVTQSPASSPLWDLHYESTKNEWNVLSTPFSVECQDDETKPKGPYVRLTKGKIKTTLPASTFVDRCTFTGNRAFNDNIDSPTAGGFLLSYGRTTLGNDNTVFIRRSTFTFNEVSSVLLNVSQERAALGGGLTISSTYAWSFHTADVTEVTASHNVGGNGGGIAIQSTAVSGQKLTINDNRALGSGGGIALLGMANSSLIGVVCNSNHALVSGGCAFVDESSALGMNKGEIRLNSIDGIDGNDLQGGVLGVSEMKLGLTNHAIGATDIQLVECDLHCKIGIPTTLFDGFACVNPLANPDSILRSVVEATPLSEEEKQMLEMSVYVRVPYLVLKWIRSQSTTMWTMVGGLIGIWMTGVIAIFTGDPMNRRR